MSNIPVGRKISDLIWYPFLYIHSILVSTRTMKMSNSRISPQFDRKGDYWESTHRKHTQPRLRAVTSVIKGIYCGSVSKLAKLIYLNTSEGVFPSIAELAVEVQI